MPMAIFKISMVSPQTQRPLTARGTGEGTEDGPRPRGYPRRYERRTFRDGRGTVLRLTVGGPAVRLSPRLLPWRGRFFCFGRHVEHHPPMLAPIGFSQPLHRPMMPTPHLLSRCPP